MNRKSKSIIITIKPEHVENIINGSKKYEYRTKAAKEDINKIIIYETVPVRKVVAEVKIEEVIMLTPEEMWKKPNLNQVLQKIFLIIISMAAIMRMHINLEKLKFILNLKN